MPAQRPPRQSWRPFAILGFILVSMPLLATVLLAGRSLDTTISQGEVLNYRVYEQTRTVRLVLEKASDIERKARLFVLLSDPALREPYERESYENVRAAFQQALEALRALSLDKEILLLTNELTEKEELIYRQLAEWNPKQQPVPAIDQAFLGLRESATGLSRTFESHVDQEFAQLREQAMASQRTLRLRSSLLLALSLGLLMALLVLMERAMARRFGALTTQEPHGPAMTTNEPAAESAPPSGESP